MRVFRLGSVFAAVTVGFGSLAACASEPAPSPQATTDGGPTEPTKDSGVPPVIDAGPAASCTDKIQNGTETGVDCGGTCKKCDGDACGIASDCQSARCEKSVCVPAGAKTCGVALPQLCELNETCVNDADCTSDYCYKTRCNTPGPESHNDKRKNAGETDVDCEEHPTFPAKSA